MYVYFQYLYFTIKEKKKHFTKGNFNLSIVFLVHILYLYY